MDKTKKIKKTIINLIIFILLIVLTFSLVLKDQNISDIFKIAMSVNKKFILIAVLSMFMYIICEAINIGRILKELGEKTTLLKNIKYTLIGFFFSAITPAASGGQPMEIYYMHKDKISVANSTMALLMHLCSFQIVSVTMGILSAIIHFNVLKTGLIYLLILGIGLNSSALILLVIAIFSKRLSSGLIKFSVKILRFFRIPRIDEKQLRLEKELTSYQESAKYIKEHKVLMLKTLITTIAQMIAYYSIPYWVYLAFGFNSQNIWEILTLQAVLYATVSGIPSPGSVGVSEGGFMGIFRNVFPQTSISSAMLLNRGINFYLLVFISAIVVIINTLKSNKENKDIILSADENIEQNQIEDSKQVKGIIYKDPGENN